VTLIAPLVIGIVVMPSVESLTAIGRERKRARRWQWARGGKPWLWVLIGLEAVGLLVTFLLPHFT
jgi:hypothetical protein